MAKKKRSKSVNTQSIPNVSRAHGAVKKLLGSSRDGGGEETEDPRYRNLTGGRISRKERRKQERQAKKDRIRAFHSRKKGGAEPTTPPETSTVKSPSGQKDDAKDGEEGRAKMEATEKRKKEAAAKKRERQKEKRAKAQEERRRRDLLEANELEDRNIKRLEKSLRFRKKKKTREVIIPAQFKYDGLDYLLDVVDSKKLEALREEDEVLSREMELDQAKERQERLARGLNDGSEGSSGEGGSDLESMDEENDTDDGGGSGNGKKEAAFDDDDDNDDGPSDEENSLHGESPASRQRGGVVGRTGKEQQSRMAEDDDDDGDSGSSNEEDSLQEESLALGQGEGLGGGRGKEELASVDGPSARNEEGGESGSESDSGVEEETGQTDDSERRKRKSPAKMDPYGRILGEGDAEEGGSYIPPHKRAAMMGESMDGQRRAELERLKRQLKGLVNRLSLSNLSYISREIEGIYLTKSRNDMNETLFDIVQEALVTPTISGERLVMEIVLLIAVLHYNIGSEVGAHFLQSMAVRFDQLHRTMADLEDKSCDNALMVLVYLYNFRIVHSCLMYDIIRRLVEGFTEQDIEMLLMVLKSAGMSLRKDDPLALKEIILSIQAKAASSTEELKKQSRVRFMLDTITALRNNDIRKMATNTNMEHLDTLRKTLRNLTKNREHSTETNMRIPLDDLLSADQKGRWWIVGSAWTGHGPNRGEQSVTLRNPDLPSIKMDHSTSEKIMELSRKQRMNTDLRRSIFGLIMTAEDYQDCFTKLLQLAVKSKQEKECVLVLIDCCQQERQFNPYYGYVLAKLCLFERKFRIASQFAYWDRFKVLDQLKKRQVTNLAALFSHLLLSKACNLSVLKVIEFADMNKNTALFLKRLLLDVLSKDAEEVRMVFGAVGGVDKLSHLRDTISLFLHHFILKQRGTRTDEEQRELKEKIGAADKSLKGVKEAQIV